MHKPNCIAYSTYSVEESQTTYLKHKPFQLKNWWICFFANKLQINLALFNFLLISGGGLKVQEYISEE